MEALRNPKVLALSVVYFGAVALNYGLSFFLPQIVKAFGLSNAQAGVVAALPYVVGLVSIVAWSRRSDRKMERRFHLAFPLFVASVGIAVSTLFDDPTLKMASLSVAGFGIFGALPVFWTFPAAFLSGAAAAGGIALINSIGNLAGFTGPFAVGRIKDLTGSYTGGLLTLSAAGLVAMIIVLVFPHQDSGARAGHQTIVTGFLEMIAVAVAAAPTGGLQDAGSEWGSPVFDLHFHLRPQLAANLAHLDGAGVAKANLLTRGNALEQVKALDVAAPGRFTWFSSYDVAQPDASQLLTQAVKNGAAGFGEMKFHLAADGPELRRAYALAADLHVPILIHFQEVDHFSNEGTWSSGFAKTFESILKAYPRTMFIGHADAFWANVSADYHNESAYPSGPIKRGGMTDRLLGDYPNLFGDLSANSGNNAMSRDAAFTADFLKRHQDKLLFGSDCGCTDGHGSGNSQANNPTAVAHGWEMRRARDADAAEAVSIAWVSRNHLEQRARAALDLRLRQIEQVLAFDVARDSCRSRS